MKNKITKYLIFMLFLLFSCKDQSKGGKLPQEDTNATLKLLKVYYAGTLISDKNYPNETEVVTVEGIISNQDVLKVDVKPNSKNAKVYFDTDTTPSLTKTYPHAPSGDNIHIKVEDGVGSTKKTKVYTVNVTQKQQELPKKKDVKCNVMNFVGGVNVSEANIKVFKSGKDENVANGKTDINGNIVFKLDKNEYYDFVVEKGGFSSSRVENVYVEESDEIQFLPIIQRKIVGKKAIAPRITDVKHFERPTENSSKMLNLKDVTNQYELNSKKERENFCGFLVSITSDSGEIIPERIGTEFNYGIGMNIGGRFSMQQVESHYFPILVSDSNGKTITRDPSTGAVTQKFVFNLAKVNFPPDERAIIYIIAYDMAGNRCERHLNVKLTHDDEIVENKTIKINAFKVLIERFTGELNTFGLNEHDGFGSSYKTTIGFAFDTDNVKISGLDIYRREYTRQTDINADWQRVDRRVFREPKTIMNKGTFFNEADNSLTLEEGKTYQYKLKAYLNNNGKLEKLTSPIATTKILPPFNIKLTFPSPNEEVELNKILQDGMKFKMSNTECWKKENADYFVFGILILSDEHSGSSVKPNEDNKQENGARFASLLRYNFNKEGNEVLEVMNDSNNWNAISGNLSDVFEYSNGNITLKKAFFENGTHNLIEGKKLSEVLKSGEMYYWDVQDWGKSALSVRDDSPTCFIKKWKIQDSKTGVELQDRFSLAISASNLLKGANAVNGRAAFTIK